MFQRRSNIVLALCLAVLVLAGGAVLLTSGGAVAAEKNPCAANPCAANPCASNPCAANPCAANPCAANPCAANPCAANPCNPCSVKNPCAAKQAASDNKPIRKYRMTDPAAVLALGERLWTDTGLGTSGSSCSTCHPGGALLNSSPYPKYIEMADDVLTLDQMINFCMINPMKGKRLYWNSQKMTALAAYVTANSGGAVNPCAVNPCNPCAAKNPCNPCGAR